MFCVMIPERCWTDSSLASARCAGVGLGIKDFFQERSDPGENSIGLGSESGEGGDLERIELTPEA